MADDSQSTTRQSPYFKACVLLALAIAFSTAHRTWGSTHPFLQLVPYWTFPLASLPIGLLAATLVAEAPLFGKSTKPLQLLFAATSAALLVAGFWQAAASYPKLVTTCSDIASREGDVRFKILSALNCPVSTYPPLT